MNADKSGEEKKELYEYTVKGEWEKVVKLYETKPWLHRIPITRFNDTALHMAINHGVEPVVEELIQLIIYNGNEEVLMIRNYRGETPLHLAAARGSVRMCEGILRAARSEAPYFISTRNKCGEVPIFTAALHNHTLAFFLLHKAFRDQRSPMEPQMLRRNNGDTVLHSVIERDYFDLAFYVIQLYPELVDKVNENGTTPLHVLASKPSAFRSGHYPCLPWYQKIIYNCVHVDPLGDDPLNPTPRKSHVQIRTCPANYLTCYQFLSSWYSVVRSFWKPLCRRDPPSGREGKQKEVEGEDPEDPNKSHSNRNMPQNYSTCYEFLAFICLHFCGIMGFGKIFTDIRKARQKHTWSDQVLDELLKRHSMSSIYDGTKPSLLDDYDDIFPIGIYRTTTQDIRGTKKGDEERSRRVSSALLVAAEKGVVEIVEKYLCRYPIAIHETTSLTNRNILMIAVNNKQAAIVDALHKHLTREESWNSHLWDDLIRQLDTGDNTILHLAANLDDSSSYSCLSYGATMQMQYEVKWYEYVKSFLPSDFLVLKNAKEETPGHIFERKHQKLANDGAEWLCHASESCSVVAALVASVSFAASTTVPGGSNDDTGKPTLIGKPAFEVFAFTALIAFCFSVTALVMFLSVLTSRKQAIDYKKNFPLKLLLGLSSLFVSIASMLVSFCAAHSFVLEDKFKKAVLPLYAAACLPVSLSIAEFPQLYVDLLKALVNKVPQPYDYYVNS